MGGMGLSHIAKAGVFEEAGYSFLGAVALNIHAADEGNIHLMDAYLPGACICGILDGPCSPLPSQVSGADA